MTTMMETRTIPASKLLDLSGKTSIVTGGALGIGRAIAMRLAEAGANVVIADVNQQEAEQVVSESSGNGWHAKAVQADVSSEESVKRMIQEAVDAHGGLDILVNNAGIYPSIPVLNMTFQDFERVLHVNLVGAFLATKYAAERMIAQGKGGKIINITSIDAIHPSAVGLAAYDASKHGLWGFTKNVALELAPHKIWVNAIAPGAVSTPGVGKVQTGQSAGEMSKALEAMLSAIPMHRVGEADDIGRVALFLASDMCSYMTGSQIVVDGGFLLT